MSFNEWMQLNRVLRASPPVSHFVAKPTLAHKIIINQSRSKEEDDIFLACSIMFKINKRTTSFNELCLKDATLWPHRNKNKKARNMQQFRRRPKGKPKTIPSSFFIPVCLVSIMEFKFHRLFALYWCLLIFSFEYGTPYHYDGFSFFSIRLVLLLHSNFFNDPCFSSFFPLCSFFCTPQLVTLVDRFCFLRFAWLSWLAGTACGVGIRLKDRDGTNKRDRWLLLVN